MAQDYRSTGSIGSTTVLLNNVSSGNVKYSIKTDTYNAQSNNGLEFFPIRITVGVVRGVSR